MKPTLLLAEASLELVPPEIADHPAVRKHAERRKKKPTEMLLDKNYHYWAMKERGLPQLEKRGRPDIVHACLLVALDAPAVREQRMNVYVHTLDNKLIWFRPGLAIPRAYHRFAGLMEQLYRQRKIVAPSGDLLIKLEDKQIDEVLDSLYYDKLVLFSERGQQLDIFSASKKLLELEAPLLVVGAFPHGDFSQVLYERADLVIKLYSEVLMAWTVTAMLVCVYGEMLRLQKFQH
ncbi:MAG: 16S rRNA methyltransferase [bacterium]|nr:16S rRNA methyltransferase [bacterium]